MKERLRYVEARRNKRDGSVRYYWRRKGHAVVRLPDDLARRVAMAASLNASADRRQRGEAAPEGTVSWVIAKYMASEKFTTLAQGTTKYYRRYISDIEEVSGDLPWTSWDRRAVVDYIEEFEQVAERRKAAAVLRNLFNTAMYYGLCTENYANKLGLGSAPRRDRWLEEREIKAWLEAAATHPKGEWAARAFHLLLYTAQRPMDVLRMTRGQYSGSTVKLRQQKTGKLLEVAVHRDLKRVLDEAPADELLLVTWRGRAVSYTHFLEVFRQISDLAGLENVQPRDLRRTACVMLAEAGATEAQIASVTGHSIETTRQILEHYLPRTVALSRAAMTLWENRG